MTAFSVRLDEGLAAGGADLLGLWAASADEAVSFTAPGAEAELVPVWQVDLAEDPARAAAALEAAQRQVAAAEAALGTAAARLETLAERESGGVSFAAEQLPAPERAALDDLEALRRARGEVSFGVEAAEAASAQAQEERGFAALVDRLVTALAFYAVVETRLAGRPAALTAIAWSADAHTVWPAAPTAALLALHARSLRLTLASRAALTRTFLVAAQGAAKLAAALAIPGVGTLAALPIAWKFINQVLAEVGRYRELQQGLQGA